MKLNKPGVIIFALALPLMPMATVKGQICVLPPSGIIGWWKGDGNGTDVVASNNAYAMPNIYFTNGVVNQAFSCNQLDGYTGVEIADQPAYVLTNSLSIEAWIRPRGNGDAIFFRGDHRPGLDPYTLEMNGGTTVAFTIFDVNNNSASVGAPLIYNQWWHVAGTLDDATGLMSLYVNGALAAQITTAIRPFGNLDPTQTPGIGIGNVNDGGNNFPFLGDIDEVALYNRALTSSEVQSIYNAGAAGKCLTPPGPPSIAVQPHDVLVNAHSTTSFSVTATGSLLLFYQWSFNGTNIPGATSSTLIPGATSSILTITNVMQANLGAYAVTVSNGLGTVTSSNAMLSMYPFLASPFRGLLTFWGYTNTISVGAWGTGPLSYQWFANGVAIADATNATLTLTSIQFSNAGLYSVVVSSPLGSVTNTPAQVVVNPAGVSLGLSPTVTIQGVVGYNYIIQRSADLTDTNAWITMTNLTLTQPVELWVDTNTDASLPANPYRFYQVLPGQ